jgi:spermidine synthase
MRRIILYSLFFLSGVSGLVYELIWQRLLHLVFGVSTLAVSAVLAAFMGGLALGGVLFGRRADRARRPQRGYALLEVGIAVSALLVPPGFALLTDVYTAPCAQWQPGPWCGAFLRFVLALLVLVVPATLIGGTLPFMARLALRPRRQPSGAFSLLYGVNTLGAVAGAALTGLILLRWLGMEQTLWLAVALNGLVAVIALLLPDPAAVGADDETDAGPSDNSGVPASPGARVPALVLLGCAVVTGAITTGLEVAWTRILGIFTSNSAYAFALVLSVLLLGLALGGLLQTLWSRRPGDSWRRLALCQWLLAGVTLTALPCLHTAPAWLDRCCDGTSVLCVLLAELTLAASVLFVPALLMGLSLPLLVSAISDDPQRFGQRLGRIYAGNTLGCVAGAFLAGFVLIPAIGLQASLGVFIAGNAAVGLVAWCYAPGSGWMLRGSVVAAVVVTLTTGWHLLPPGVFLKARIEEPRHLLYYSEGNNGTVSVVEEPGGIRKIEVDGQPVAGTSETSMLDQKMLAHLPLLLHPGPHRALTVGFGSGGTSHSMTLHGIDVDCVEIERAVPDAAEHFRSENHDVRRHPHFHLILDDARSWLRVAPQRYDAIVTDCTNIQYKCNGDLYTVEYFQLLRDRLAAQGIAAAWVPASGIEGADLKTLLRSFKTVFPHTSVWYMSALPTDFLIVIGTPAPLAVDLDQLRQRMAVPDVYADLAAVGLADPFRLLYTFLTSDADLERYLGAGPLHTDDKPILSYTTYGATYKATIAANLLELLAQRRDVAHYVRHEEPPSLLLRYYAGTNAALLGHVAFLRGQHREALAHYAVGARLLPDDVSLRRLVVTLYAEMQRGAGTEQACLSNQ